MIRISDMDEMRPMKQILMKHLHPFLSCAVVLVNNYFKSFKAYVALLCSLRLIQVGMDISCS
jgi:hypothetical protein